MTTDSRVHSNEALKSRVEIQKSNCYLKRKITELLIIEHFKYCFFGVTYLSLKLKSLFVYMFNVLFINFIKTAKLSFPTIEILKDKLFVRIDMCFFMEKNLNLTII